MTGLSPLSLTRYGVIVEALEPLALPAYLGSPLRGAFGRPFRTLCCPAGPDEPCLFPYFVVTLGEGDRIGRGRRAVRVRRIDAVHPLRDTTESAYRAEDSLVRAIDGRVTLDGLGAYRLEGIEAEEATA